MKWKSPVKHLFSPSEEKKVDKFKSLIIQRFHLEIQIRLGKKRVPVQRMEESAIGDEWEKMARQTSIGDMKKDMCMKIKWFTNPNTDSLLLVHGKKVSHFKMDRRKVERKLIVIKLGLIPSKVNKISIHRIKQRLGSVGGLFKWAR